MERVVGVDHERPARVERRDLEGPLVVDGLAVSRVREHEPVADAADAHPLDNLHVAGVLVGGDAEVVELLDLVAQLVVDLLGVLAVL